MLGLGSNLTKGGAGAKTIVTDSLVLKHNYAVGAVQPLSSGAASFNGTSDYIAINAKPVDTADATYCFWARADETGENRAIFAHGDGATGEFSTNHAGSGKPLLYLNSDLYQYWADTGFADDGKWHHWALVVDIDDMTACKLYCDGVEIAQDVRTTSGTATSYGNLEIGRSSTSHEFEGYMCNFGVWSSHLSQPQVKSIMNKNYDSLSDSEKTDLVSWWNLDSVIPDTTTLVYDNHHGGGDTLGSEKITSGDFNGGATDWDLGNAAWQQGSGNGEVKLTKPSSGNSVVYQTGLSFAANTVLRYRFDIVDYSGSSQIKLDSYSSSNPLNTSTSVIPSEGNVDIYVTTDRVGSAVFLYLTGGSTGDTVTIDNISVKEVNGNTGTLS